MPNLRIWTVGLFALSLVCFGPTLAQAQEKKQTEGFQWSKLNPFHIDDTKSVKRAATHKVAPTRRKVTPNRFKPTRSAAKPKRSPWQVVKDSTKKMADSTRNVFNFKKPKKTDSARDRVAPTLAEKPKEKKKTSFTSWLPWSKTKKR